MMRAWMTTWLSRRARVLIALALLVLRKRRPRRSMCRKPHNDRAGSCQLYQRHVVVTIGHGSLKLRAMAQDVFTNIRSRSMLAECLQYY